MTDDRSQTNFEADMPNDAAIEQIIPPEQPPMDDAAGGPSVAAKNDQEDEVSTDAPSVQGGR